jgi:multidrug efflux pump
LRDEGFEILEAIQQAAARRLRPILMTSIATVFGAIPLAIASGAGGAARSAIGVVIVFGVTLATFISLILIPIIYARLAKYTGSPEAVSRRLAKEMKMLEAPLP